MPAVVLLVLALCLPASKASGMYQQFAISDGMDLFCGLTQAGQAECFSSLVREPEVINGDPLNTYTKLDAGSGLVCGITTAQTVSCWGDNVATVLQVPAFDHPVVDISVSPYHACAIDSIGGVKCWGQSEQGQTLVPFDGQGYRLIATRYQQSCGLRIDGEMVCWGSNALGQTLPVDADSLVTLELPDFMSMACGVQTNGNAICWSGNGEIDVRFEDGPYTHVSGTLYSGGTPDLPSATCAITINGEVDCVRMLFSQSPSDIERVPNQFVTMVAGRTEMCGYTFNDRLECLYDDPDNVRRSKQLRDVVNRDLDIPLALIEDAQFYGFGVELFFDIDETPGFYDTIYDLEIFRDGELLLTNDSLVSYLDRDIEQGREYQYTARLKHIFGQVGELSDPISIVASNTEEPVVSQNPAVNRPDETTGLRAEVYWFDVELFWDRNNSGNVVSYEIRRDGELVATTRGVSYYDNSTVGDKRYVYDVIAVDRDGQMLGFQSTQVQIGDAVCQ